MKDNNIIIDGVKVDEKLLFNSDNISTNIINNIFNNQKEKYKYWLDNYKAFEANVYKGHKIIVSKSAKKKDHYQITTFIKGDPASDIILSNKEDVINELCNYDNLQLTNYIKDNTSKRNIFLLKRHHSNICKSLSKAKELLIKLDENNFSKKSPSYKTLNSYINSLKIQKDITSEKINKIDNIITDRNIIKQR